MPKKSTTPIFDAKKNQDDENLKKDNAKEEQKKSAHQPASEFEQDVAELVRMFTEKENALDFLNRKTKLAILDQLIAQNHTLKSLVSQAMYQPDIYAGYILMSTIYIIMTASLIGPIDGVTGFFEKFNFEEAYKQCKAQESSIPAGPLAFFKALGNGIIGAGSKMWVEEMNRSLGGHIQEELNAALNKIKGHQHHGHNQQKEDDMPDAQKSGAAHGAAAALNQPPPSPTKFG